MIWPWAMLKFSPTRQLCRGQDHPQAVRIVTQSPFVSVDLHGDNADSNEGAY